MHTPHTYTHDGCLLMYDIHSIVQCDSRCTVRRTYQADVESYNVRTVCRTGNTMQVSNTVRPNYCGD